jgi:hypothetical protein
MIFLQRIAFFIIKTSELEFVLNMKVVALFLSFSTHIFTSQSDTHNSSYGLHGEQRPEHVKYFENMLWPINWYCSKVRKTMFLTSN